MRTILMLLVATTVASATVLPSGGITDRPWVIGQQASVQWDPTAFTGRVSIDLWSASERAFRSLATDIDPALGRVDIIVPVDIAPGELFRVRIAEDQSSQHYDMSAGFFPIRAPFMIDPVTSVYHDNGTGVPRGVSVTPNPAQDVITVRWNSPDVLGVRLYTVNGTVADDIRVTPDMREVSVQRGELSSGLYIVETYGSGGAARTTIVLD